MKLSVLDTKNQNLLQKDKKYPMGSLYKDLLAYGKGLPPHRQQPSKGYDFVFSNALRAHEYRILGKKGEGTFSEVLKCQHVKDGTYYACKKMKQHYDGVEQVNNLREIQAMRRLNPHANIIELHEIIFDKKTGTVALICELMDMNIYELIRGRRHYLPESKIKNYMFQLLKSLDHMHRCGIFHRDVKPENILVKDDVLKLADFGSCRSVYSKQPYTEYISTRWYRAPECLLTDGYYTYRMDLWSVGCVFFEVMSLHPLFPGANEVDQIAKIHDVLGTPDASVLNKLKHRNRGINFDFPPKKGTGVEKLLPHASQQCLELIYKMCTYDPDERITAKQALRHPYFRDLREAEKRAHEAQHESRYNETTSVKPAPAATTVDVPLWKQNQVQKKRLAEREKASQELYNKTARHIQKLKSELSSSDSENNRIEEHKNSIKKQIEKHTKLSRVGEVIKFQPSKDRIIQSTKMEEAPAFKKLLQSLPSNTRDSNVGQNKFKMKRSKRNECSPPKSKNGLPLKKPVLWKTPVNTNAIGSKKALATVVKNTKRKEKQLLEEERRQRRFVEQHPHLHHHMGHSTLPQLVPINGTAIHGPTGFSTTSSKQPFPSTTLPKIPHHLHNPHLQGGSNLLPGLIKTNQLGTKHLGKSKIKPGDTSGKVYGHYHPSLPSINRHLYH